MPDVLRDLALQIRDRREDAAREDVALDLGEPELDLIQPRRVRGREVQLHTAMLGEERPHGLRLVGQEIVKNDVDLAPLRLRRDDVRANTSGTAPSLYAARHTSADFLTLLIYKCLVHATSIGIPACRRGPFVLVAPRLLWWRRRASRSRKLLRALFLSSLRVIVQTFLPNGSVGYCESAK